LVKLWIPSGLARAEIGLLSKFLSLKDGYGDFLSTIMALIMAGFKTYRSYPIGSMYGIYAHIWGILMVNVTIYIAYMDPMGTNKNSPSKSKRESH
jgi:hypothetical protein